MTNLKTFVALFIGATLSYSASSEISVFDAGNLDSSSPYGLTDNEKTFLKNKQNVENLSRNMGDVESNLNAMQERLEGLQSVLDGLNSRMSRIEKRLNDLEGNDGNSTAKSDFDELKKYVEESRKIQETNNAKITKALKDMGALIDKSNAAPAATKKNDEDKPVASSSPAAAESQAPKIDFTKQKNQDVASEAKKLFDAGKLDDAKARYEYLLSKDHKPAMANFYLGEIAYQQKAYNNAIKYYQQSIQLYDKAEYTPKLLYHTAISFDKIKDTASANKFYKALKLGYPDSKEAKAAPTRN